MTSRTVAPPPAKGGLRAQQKASTRRRLIDATMEVFSDKGYAATTVDDIASAAGTSTATFYLHFKRKIDVLTASVEDEAAQVSSMAGPLPPSDELDAESLKAWVQRVFASWQVLRVPHQVLGQAVLIEPELKERQITRLSDGIAYWEDFLDQLGMARGKRRTAEAALLNAQFVGLFEMWIVSGLTLDRKALTERLADVLWHRVLELRGEQRRAV